MSRFASFLFINCLFALADPADSSYPQAIKIDGCPNVFAVSDTILSGGLPDGETAFKALADAGVKTIVSVDGAKPDVDAAAKHGLRYVHLPFGYDSVPRSRALEISRALKDLPGKTYVHCNHGKHRSPAAVAAVMVYSQGWNNDRALSFMEKAGTAPGYIGLYDDVKNAKPARPEEVAAADATFPSVANVEDFVELMISLEHRFDALTEVKNAGWRIPPKHPDIIPAHEALQVAELYRESIRTGQANNSNAGFLAWITTSESAAVELEMALKSGSHETAETAYATLKENCAACHAKYRNVPQTEKAAVTPNE